MPRCRAMMESSPEGDTWPRLSWKLVPTTNKYKLKHNCCTVERDFMNLAEPPNGGEDHQHDFEIDSVMSHR